MLTSVKSIVIYFIVGFLLEYCVEKNFGIKRYLKRKIGHLKYNFLVFILAIIILVIINMISLDLFNNIWVQGIYMGTFMFGLLHMDYPKKTD